MPDTRWALVAGASRGLGLGLATELQRRGWNVVATVRDEAGAKRAQALSVQPGCEVQVERLDINDDAGIVALRQRLDGRVFDLVFVNAGIAPPERRGAVQATRQQATDVFLTNAVAPIRVAHAFLDRVQDGRGVIALSLAEARKKAAAILRDRELGVMHKPSPTFAAVYEQYLETRGSVRKTGLVLPGRASLLFCVDRLSDHFWRFSDHFRELLLRRLNALDILRLLKTNWLRERASF